MLATRATKPSEPIFLYNAVTAAETKVIATPIEDPGPKYRSFPDPARPVALAPDSRLVAVYSPPRHPAYSYAIPAEIPLSVIHLIDVATGKRTAQIAAPKRTVVKLAFSPDGRVLAAENADETITLFEVVSGQERATLGKEAPLDKSVLPGHLPPPNWNPDGFSQPTALLSTIAFSADSTALAARGPGSTVRVWDVLRLEALGVLKGHASPVLSVAFSPDGNALASGSADTTILAWDTARLRLPPTKAPALKPNDVQSCWADLASPDARLAFRTMQRLIAGAEAAAPILREQLKPAPPADPTKLDRWLADLDSENFKTRTVAVRELEKLGDVALPALEKALASRPNLESRRRQEALIESLTTGRVKAEQIRAVRAIEVLERTGTPDARTILELLAKGAPGALATRHAAAALGRARSQPARR